MRHNEYRHRRVAHVFRCHPGVKELDGRLIWESKGPPDFSGILMQDHRPVMFDAKETRQPHFPFENLKLHQADHLEWCHALGGLSFVAIHAVVTRKRLVLPWSVLRQPYLEWIGTKDRKRAAKGTASISFDLCIEMNTGGWLDWAMEQP